VEDEPMIGTKELRAMVKDAVACHFDDGEAPKIIGYTKFAKK